MTATRRASQSSAGSCAPCRSGVGSTEKPLPDHFPAGLKVLVVDDDVVCLMIVEQMLRRCHYHVTTSSQATVALELLREKKGSFDVVLSDVHMPDIDGFKLLELVGLEMDLPVIMMSADGTTSAVMKGIRHGACDYLIKPIREAELKNIWQHVVRKKWNGNKEYKQSGSLDDNDQQRRAYEDTEYASSINEEGEGLKSSKKRGSNREEDDSEPDNDDPSNPKKPRVVWSVELHQQFVSAVNQLGLDKAVPKRILELMNVPGLTRENVASHLQKFRLYLKRLCGGGPQQQSGFSNPFCGSIESNGKLGTYGRFDIEALAASGHIPQHTLAALHAEILGRPAGHLGQPIDQPSILHASYLGPKCVPIEHGFGFGQPTLKPQSSMFKQFPTVSSVEDALRFGSWAPNVMVGQNNQNNNFFVQPALHSEPGRSINVQPSCLVVPAQSSAMLQTASPSTVNQNCSFNRSSGIDYTIFSPPSNNNLVLNGIPSGDNISTVTLCGFSAPGSSTPTSCLLSGDKSLAGQNPALPISDANLLHGPYGTKSGKELGQGPFRNLGYVGKGTLISSPFGGDEFEPLSSNWNHRNLHCDSGSFPVKQEPNVESMDDESPTLRQRHSNDLTSIFTK